MINNRQNGRRGRGRNGVRPQGGGAPRPEQGNRIDNRSRGNANQLHEKYKTLARDSQMAGDRVLTEYYLQFADHYFRVLSETRARFDEQRPRQEGPQAYQDDYDADGSDDDGYDDAPRQQAPRREERPTEARQPERNRDDNRPREDARRDENRRDEPRRDDNRREEGRREEARREDGRRDEVRQPDARRDDQRREEPRRDEPRFERGERLVRRDRAERPAPAPAAVDAPVTSEAAPETAPAVVEAPRPRRGRPPRAAQPAADTVEPQFDMAVLPPSIAASPAAPVEAETAADEDAPRKVRRTRRPRAVAGENDATGDVAA